MLKSKPRVAIFDIDGTIFRKNLHFELINELVWFGTFPKSVRSELTALYADWLEHEGTYEAYRHKLVELYAEHIRGCRPSDVKRACDTLLPFHEKRTYLFAEHLITKLRAEGYFLIAISGSPSEIVEEYNRRYLKFDRVFGSVYALDGVGKYTGEAITEPTLDKGSFAKRVLNEESLDFADSYGMGDTESDAGFLELVAHPIAFNPNRNLKSIAEENNWRIVVEKKDVVYDRV